MLLKYRQNRNTYNKNYIYSFHRDDDFQDISDDSKDNN